MSFKNFTVIILILFIFIVNFNSLKAETIGDWMEKGNILYEEGNYSEAIKCYDKVLEAEPEHIKACCNKANSLYALGYYDEAIIYYEQTLKLDPGNEQAHNYKEEAEKAMAFQEEQADTPEEIWALYASLLLKGNFERSLRYICRENLEQYENMSQEEKEGIKAFYFASLIYDYDIIKRKVGHISAFIWFEGTGKSLFGDEPEELKGTVEFVKEEDRWKIKHISTESI